MSQRLGMADGRCFTVNSSAQLFNNYVMKQNGISFEDNYSYRKLLQSQGPQLLTKVQEMYKVRDHALSVIILSWIPPRSTN